MAAQDILEHSYVQKGITAHNWAMTGLTAAFMVLDHFSQCATAKRLKTLNGNEDKISFWDNVFSGWTAVKQVKELTGAKGLGVTLGSVFLPRRTTAYLLTKHTQGDVKAWHWLGILGSPGAQSSMMLDQMAQKKAGGQAVGRKSVSQSLDVMAQQPDLPTYQESLPLAANPIQAMIAPGTASPLSGTF